MKIIENIEYFQVFFKPENVDFFKNDSAQSIAHKIVTSNLSDLSAMGAKPYCYTLNLCMPKYITIDWLESFSNYLIKLQKKYI